MRNNIKKIMIAVGDYLFFFLALYLVVTIRYNENLGPDTIMMHFRPFSLIFLSWILVLYIWDTYSLTSRWSHKNTIVAMSINTAIAMGVFYVVPSLQITPKTNLVLTAAASFGFLYIWRFSINRYFHFFQKHRNVALIGADSHSLKLLQTMLENKKLGYKPVLVVAEGASEELKKITEDIRIINDLDQLEQAIIDLKVKEVVISDKWYGRTIKNLYPLIPLGLNFYHIATFWEIYNRTIPVYSSDEIWFLSNLPNVIHNYYDLFKRVLDLLAVILVAPLVLPLLLFTAILVKVSSKGPVLYSQIRTGKEDKPFRIYKFRSMVIDAEAKGAQWSTENDPRITPVGRFIRKTRLDELPQFYNILVGEMSIVGPRPERPEFVEDLTKQIPHYHLRHLIRPGLTGWAQINYPYGASVEDAARKLEYDLYYLKHRNLILDIKISLKTILTVVNKMGR